MNSEIVHRLQESFELSEETFTDRLNELRADYDKMAATIKRLTK